MKKNICLLTIVVTLWGCQSDPEFEKVSDLRSRVITGKVNYTDVLTDELIEDDATIEVTLDRVGGSAIPPGLTNPSIGYEFLFGGLELGGGYTITATKKGTPEYAADTTIRFTTKLVSDFKLTMTTGTQTLLVAQVLTDAGAPVSDASLMLFNDLSFLAAFGETGGFIDSLQTNRSGKALFTDLAPGDYYLFPFKVIGADTLRRDLNVAIEPITIRANQVNTDTVYFAAVE